MGHFPNRLHQDAPACIRNVVGAAGYAVIARVDPKDPTVAIYGSF